jgi:hypothetical protein
MTAQKARRMSSRAVRLGMLGALSLTLVGCGGSSDDEVQAYCVDQNSLLPDGSYEIVDEDLCDDDGYRSSHAGGYYWYYGGSRNGSRILKGTTVRPKDVTVVTAKGKTLQRGGFGGRSSSGGS